MPVLWLCWTKVMQCGGSRCSYLEASRAQSHRSDARYGSRRCTGDDDVDTTASAIMYRGMPVRACLLRWLSRAVVL
jgi:hypothetical protein